MIDKGIDRIKISVWDMAESLAFFVDLLETKLVAEAELDAAAVGSLWALDWVDRTHAACLQNAVQSTMIERLNVGPNTGRFIRRGAKNFNRGLFEVAFRVKGVDKTCVDLRTGAALTREDPHFAPEGSPMSYIRRFEPIQQGSQILRSRVIVPALTTL